MNYLSISATIYNEKAQRRLVRVTTKAAAVFKGEELL